MEPTAPWRVRRYTALFRTDLILAVRRGRANLPRPRDVLARTSRRNAKGPADEYLREIPEIRRWMRVHGRVHAQSREQNCMEWDGWEVATLRWIVWSPTLRGTLR